MCFEIDAAETVKKIPEVERSFNRNVDGWLDGLIAILPLHLVTPHHY